MAGKSLSLIGAGVMGEALLSGIADADLYDRKNITVADLDELKVQKLSKEHGVRAGRGSRDAADAADVVILAVKPRQVRSVLEEIGHSLKADTLVISVAAGVETQTIASFLGPDVPIVRVMPNTAAQVGAAISVISAGPSAADEHVEVAKEIFSTVGEVLVVPEKLQNQATALSGSGPAYFYLFVETLIEAGVKAGLGRETASKLVVETLVGSGTMLKNTGKHPAVLKDMVCSPGGTTMAAVGALEKAGFRAATFKAVEAAMKRAAELGRNGG
ncbi:MAG: pyrroline-5-carboxylate reductase [Terriglobia bacterium]